MSMLSCLDPILKKAKRYPLLPTDEVIYLTRLIQAYIKHPNPSRRLKWHYVKAREKMVNHNIRLPVRLALKYAHRATTSHTIEDIYADGLMGLDHSLTKYDSTRGYAFSTYASTWIKQRIVRGIENSSATIRIPIVSLHGIRRYMHRSAKEPGLTIEQFLATDGSLGVKRAGTIRDGLTVLNVKSLNTRSDAGDGQRAEWLDFVPSGSTNTLEDLAKEDQYRQMYEAIDNLEEPYGVAFKMKHFENASNTEIAESLGIERRKVTDVLCEARSQLRATLTC